VNVNFISLRDAAVAATIAAALLAVNWARRKLDR
jgi:hypothetical protein